MNESASIAVVGCGWVGLVTAIGFAERGHRVKAFDIDVERIERLQRDDFPISEPGVADAARMSRSLSFHTTGERLDPDTDFVFLALPTPPREDGSVDLTYLAACTEWLAESGDSPELPAIVVRSTAPPGTAAWVETSLRELTGRRYATISNPEFLQEGKALQDFRAPSRVVIGSDDAMAGAALAALYSFVDGPVLQTDARTAEMAKYAANAFLAMRVSFANEMASVAEAAGADVACMMHAVGLDPRIGSRYLSPGIGYGGSCLNKDLTALIEFGSEMRQPMLLSKATCAVNEARRDTVLSLLHERLGGLRGRRIALIGMAFKPGTNDIRDAPAVYLASRLQEQGAELQAWDPCVTAGQLTSMPNVELTHHLYEAFENADAAVLCTEWPEALEADLSHVAAIMRGSLLIDGRYGWSPQEARREGLCVLRIGATGTEIS